MEKNPEFQNRIKLANYHQGNVEISGVEKALQTVEKNAEEKDKEGKLGDSLLEKIIKIFKGEMSFEDLFSLFTEENSVLPGTPVIGEEDLAMTANAMTDVLDKKPGSHNKRMIALMTR